MKLKKIVKAVIRVVLDRNYRFILLTEIGFYKRMDDEEYIKRQYKAYIKKELNLDAPKTFNEKMQWLKLHDRRPEYTIMVDKYLVREYVKNTIGEEYLIPLIGSWEKAEDIDFGSLPDQFVLKCNHNSGMGMYICKDRIGLNKKEIVKNLNKGLKQDYYKLNREWPYKDVKRRIVAEKYMVDESGTELKDYKFMCFNGSVKCIFVCSERFSEDGLKVTFFDRGWNKMPFERHYKSSNNIIKKPYNFNKMIELAEILSKDIPFVRVDFYEVSRKIYFGELTFYPGSGYEEFEPEEWDNLLGDWLCLPKESFGD